MAALVVAGGGEIRGADCYRWPLSRAELLSLPIVIGSVSFAGSIEGAEICKSGVSSGSALGSCSSS